MKNKFNDAMNSVYPTDEQKNRMFENALSMAESDKKHTSKRKSIKIIISGILIAAAMTSTTVFASEIKNVFRSFFKDDKIISENIIDNIYEDSNEHIEFKVERIVSDRITTYAIVSYTALDEQGKEWLYGGFEPYIRECTDDKGEKRLIQSDLWIKPDGDMSFSTDVGDNEYKDSADDNTRTFRLNCQAADEVTGSETVTIEYPMFPVYKRTAKLNVSESIALKQVEFEDVVNDKPYIPKGAKYSSLGLMIYGDDNGYSQLSDEERSQSLITVRIALKDGSYLATDHCLIFVDVSYKNKEYDYSLFSTYFSEPIDADSITGVVINGVFYEF